MNFSEAAKLFSIILSWCWHGAAIKVHDLSNNLVAIKRVRSLNYLVITNKKPNKDRGWKLKFLGQYLQQRKHVAAINSTFWTIWIYF